MEPDCRIPVVVPDDLDQVIQRGIARGKKIAAHRRHMRQVALRSACSFVLVMGLLIGGIHLSPAFAAAMEDVPVFGHLVRIFGKNEPVVQGGTGSGGGTAAVTMERSSDSEQIRLEFRRANASLYTAEFASFPKTVTVTLPGTSGVEVLSEISRARDTSQYIKSVCVLPTSTRETAVLQLELESDADVQIEEYSDPGSLVIRLTPADTQMDTVYSVRTLSRDAQSIGEAAGQAGRLLRDESGMFFVELAQYPTREAAEAACAGYPGDVIVEQRTGNNVPACFPTMEDYERSRFLDSYYQLLITSDSAEPVLDFLDKSFAAASPEAQEEMLRGLTGFLEDSDEEVNWEKAASFYQMARQDVPESIQQHIQK